MADFIDVHAHFLPDFYVAAASAAGHEVPDGMPAWPPWSVDAHLAMMDAQGIGTSMLSISSPGVHFGSDVAATQLARRVNDYGAGLAADRSDRFGHFAALPLPNVDDALAELARALDELGSDGLAVETNTDGIYLGAARYEPLWAEADRRGAAIFVHPTSPPGWEKIALGRPRPMLEFLFDSARTASDLLFAAFSSGTGTFDGSSPTAGECCRSSRIGSSCSAPLFLVTVIPTAPAPGNCSPGCGMTSPEPRSRIRFPLWSVPLGRQSCCTAATSALLLPQRSPSRSEPSVPPIFRVAAPDGKS